MLYGRLTVVAGDPDEVDAIPPPQERSLRPGEIPGLRAVYPGAVTRLALQVLMGQERPFWHCEDAVGIGHRVRVSPSVPAADIRRLVDQLLRLRCAGAQKILGNSGGPQGG